MIFELVIDREHESDYARYVLEHVLGPDPETLIELVDLKRKAEKENGPDCHCRAVDLPANHNGVCPICQQAKSEEWRGVYPGYCIDPETCRGYSHCPRNYSCIE